MQGKEPFEQLWMVKYIDERLVADSSQTRRILDWKPTPRKSITRRLVFLIENRKRNPELWRQWNEAMLHKEDARPHLALHELLCESLEKRPRGGRHWITEQLLSRDEVVREMTAQSLDSEQPQGYASCIRALEAMPNPVVAPFTALVPVDHHRDAHPQPADDAAVCAHHRLFTDERRLCPRTGKP